MNPELIAASSDKLTAEQANEIGWRHVKGHILPQDSAAARLFFGFAADSGHAKAQNNLAAMMLYGEGGPKDEAGARVLFAKSAAQDEPVAQCNLALMMQDGRGGPQDEAGGFALLGKAAAQGYRLAQHNLAIAMLSGRGCSIDEAGARVLLAKAALPRSNFMLGKLMERGIGGPQDTSEALDLYTAAANAGVKEAELALYGLSVRGLEGFRGDSQRPASEWNNLKAVVGRRVGAGITQSQGL